MDKVFLFKFGALSLVFMILIWKLGGASLPTTWRIMFTLCAPIGIYFALAGKSISLRSRE